MSECEKLHRYIDQVVHRNLDSKYFLQTLLARAIALERVCHQSQPAVLEVKA